MSTQISQQETAAATTRGELNTGPSAPASPATPAANFTMLRYKLHHITPELVEGHRHERRDALRQAASTLALQDSTDVLQTLGAYYGLAWTTVSQMVGVSATAVRKWRRGDTISGEYRSALAELLAFLQYTETCNSISKVGQWLDTRLPDTTLTPADVYKLGGSDSLLDWLCGFVTVTAMLDEVVPDWRQKYARDSHFMVGEGPDGDRAIVSRSQVE